MKNIGFFFGLLFFCARLQAQNLVPPFVPQDIDLAVPAFLPGVMKDATAKMQNDTLYYHLSGMVFRNGYKIYTGSKGLPHADPFETLFEMVDAYAKRDKERIVSLYSASSADAIKKLVNGPEGVEYLSYVNASTHGSMELLGVFEYQNGYIAFVRDNENKVHQNYIVKEGAEYKLAAFTDNKATSWNLNVYFNTMPQPVVPLRSAVRKDSMAVGDSVMIQTTVPSNAPYVAFITNKPGQAATLMVLDNTKSDLNLTKGRVSFYVPGYLFPKEGTNVFYLVGFNYPVSYISANVLTKEAEHAITIYR